MSASRRTEGTVGAPVYCARKIIDFYALPALGVPIAPKAQPALAEGAPEPSAPAGTHGPQVSLLPRGRGFAATMFRVPAPIRLNSLRASTPRDHWGTVDRSNKRRDVVLDPEQRLAQEFVADRRQHHSVP